MLGYATISDSEVDKVSKSEFRLNNTTSGTAFRVSDDVRSLFNLFEFS